MPYNLSYDTRLDAGTLERWLVLVAIVLYDHLSYVPPFSQQTKIIVCN